jgi:hypothetical protein
MTRGLDESKDRMLQTAAGNEIVLAHATAIRMVAAWTLAPAPLDPVAHCAAAHGKARSHLVRLTTHDPAAEVSSVMTGELFVRLTEATPAPLTAPAGVQRYTYTPRKILRRVLDHALDHLNQLDQWVAWRRDGVVPTPTDGWVPSTETLPDDRLPLDERDLGAWLWRIDQAARLLHQRAGGLTREELDWAPPDGGWPLRRVLHHVARSELLYATALDEALPSNDPATRYREACRRLGQAVRETSGRGQDPSVVYAGLYGVLRTPEQVIGDVVTIEDELRAAVA